jgi:hypothetical protein
VKEQLEDYINRALHGASFNLYLAHNNGWINLRDNEAPIVWHEQILDECWDQ